MATLETTQYAAQSAVGSLRSSLSAIDAGAKLRYFEIDITFAGTPAIADTINFIRLPSKHKILPFQSFYKSSASWGAGATMDIGYRTFVKEDGSVQAEVASGITSNLDMTVTTRATIVGTAGSLADAMGQVEVTGRGSDIVVYGTIEVDAPAAGDTLKILLAVLVD